jgi:Cdc6-like AAA superfamily ATPase
MVKTWNGATKTKILNELSRFSGTFDRQKLDYAYEQVKEYPYIPDDTATWRLSQGNLDLICRLMRWDKCHDHPFFTWMIDNAKSFGERKPHIGGDYLLDYAIAYNVPDDKLNYITVRTLLENAARGVTEYEYEYGKSIKLSHVEEGGLKIIAERFAEHHKKFRDYLEREPCIKTELVIAGVDLSFWETPVPFKDILKGVENSPEVSETKKDTEGRAVGLYLLHQYKDAPTFEEYKKNYVLQENLDGHITRFQHRLEFDKEMAGEGANTARNRHHIVLTGPAGTGKTTLARAIGRLYKDLGILDQGHVIETSGAAVIGEYVGHSAPNLREMGKAAKGGILFLDEAYHIANNDKFGPDVVTELLRIMEDMKDDLIVIIAGYEEDTERLMQMNPGLPSRFGNRIEFDHFTREELHQILDIQVQAKGLYIRDDAAKEILDHMMWAKDQDERNPVKQYGNARDMATLLDKVIDYHAVSFRTQEDSLELGTSFEGAIEKCILGRQAAVDAIKEKKGKIKGQRIGFAPNEPQL